MPASDRRQPPTTVSVDELAQISELMTTIDVFLRSHPIPDLLTKHLRDMGSDHPGYDTALLIDQISFTAHALRPYRGGSAQG